MSKNVNDAGQDTKRIIKNVGNTKSKRCETETNIVIEPIVRINDKIPKKRKTNLFGFLLILIPN